MKTTNQTQRKFILRELTSLLKELLAKSKAQRDKQRVLNNKARVESFVAGTDFSKLPYTLSDSGKVCFSVPQKIKLEPNNENYHRVNINSELYVDCYGPDKQLAEAQARRITALEKTLLFEGIPEAQAIFDRLSQDMRALLANLDLPPIPAAVVRPRKKR